MMKITGYALLFLAEALVLTCFILLSRKWLSDHLEDKPHAFDSGRKCFGRQGIMS
jgi:hypothetical protein